MIFIGIDPSLTSTGLVVLDSKGEMIRKEIISSNKNFSIEMRIIEIRDKIKKILEEYYDYHINLSIEGISYGSKGKSSIDIPALNISLRIFFLDKEIDFFVVEPSVLKKYITGKGNAKKELMLLKIYKKFGIEFESNDLADAYSLALFYFDKFKNLEKLKNES